MNWYWLLDDRPPMSSTGGFWMNTRIPGTAASFCDSACATWSALICRSARSLRCMMKRPWFTVLVRPPPPTADMNPSMLGSSWTMAAAARWCCTMAS